MDHDLAPALARWKVRTLFPYQEQVIRRILGDDHSRLAVILPTGSGKSLCFQIPAEFLPHPTLVIYPLRSLTADQKRRCDQAGVGTVTLQGGQTRAQRHEIWSQLGSGTVKLLLSNPETLEQPAVLARLKAIPLSHAVVDEAHCIHLWGTRFRPSYQRLGALLGELGVPRITAFTATATEQNAQSWRAALFRGEDFTILRASADRPNLDFSQEPYLSLRRSLPRTILREERPALVFCRSREQVRRWAHHLHRETALDVRFYHAGLSRAEKTRIEAWFFESSDGVLVTTNAYGLGVDKSNIRTVLHLEAPPGPEDYLQEAGRAGRDGRRARVVLFVKSRPHPEPAECRRRALLAWFGEPEGPCSGCDVCRGQDRSPPLDAGPAVTRLAAFVHRLNQREVKAFLMGRVTPTLWESDLPRLPGWGLWQQESDLTAGELWKGLLDGGWVRFHSRGPWKGLLAPGSTPRQR